MLDADPSTSAAPASPRPRRPSPRSRPRRAPCPSDRSCRPCRPACGGSGSSCPSTSSDIAGMPAAWTLGPMSAPSAGRADPVGLDAAQQRGDLLDLSRARRRLPVKPKPVGRKTPLSDSSIITWLASSSRCDRGRPARRGRRSPRWSTAPRERCGAAAGSASSSAAALPTSRCTRRRRRSSRCRRPTNRSGRRRRRLRPAARGRGSRRRR